MRILPMLLMTCLISPVAALDWYLSPTVRSHTLAPLTVGASLAMESDIVVPDLHLFLSGGGGLNAGRGFIGVGVIEPKGNSMIQLDAASASIGIGIALTSRQTPFANRNVFYVGIEGRFSPAWLLDGPTWLHGLHVDVGIMHDRIYNDSHAAIGIGWGF